ncbi:hypothetical protein LSAT2_000953 [Lamellibrachia satsuma]|nr:hypothetical protein LSAT2_000953 [Lamellibrachia satsuma]
MQQVQVNVTRANGDDLDLADPVGPVNNWLHLLFSQVDVYLNGTLVTPSTNTYAYRAYIETLLSYGTDAKATQLTSQLWHKDTVNHLDAVEIDDGAAANAGFVARRANIVRSRVVDMMCHLHVDLFLQDKFLINGVDVKIQLVRSKSAFGLMAGGANPDYRINVINATLFIKKATLNPSIQMAHIKALQKSTVRYPMRSVDCKVYSIPAGARSHTHENLFIGTLPKRLVLCASIMMHTTVRKPRIRFTPRKSPSTSSQCVAGRGERTVSSDFRHGYTFGFDLTPDECHDACFHLVQKGYLRIEMHFRDALPTTVNVIAYAEFESVLEINKSRNIIYDY